MAKASDKTGEGHAADTADFSRVADALKDMPHVPLHPLMAHPAAALAAATAIGFGLATHMTSVFLGSLQGAVEATNKLARKLEEEKLAAEAVPAAPSEPTGDGSEAAEPVVVARKPRKAPVKPAEAKVAPAPKARKVAAKVVKAEKPETVEPVARATKTVRTSGKPDDLKKIEGIGPKLEQVLNEKGIRRFAHLAALDAEALEALDKEIGLGGRAVRDDWSGQARKLAGTKS
ncbi:MAG: 5' DNA nuclease [Shinella sp.]|nr:MAG: 5' DNA nuclease [Shinella sp.]